VCVPWVRYYYLKSKKQHITIYIIIVETKDSDIYVYKRLILYYNIPFYNISIMKLIFDVNLYLKFMVLNVLKMC